MSSEEKIEHEKELASPICVCGVWCKCVREKKRVNVSGHTLYLGSLDLA